MVITPPEIRIASPKAFSVPINLFDVSLALARYVEDEYLLIDSRRRRFGGEGVPEVWDRPKHWGTEMRARNINDFTVAVALPLGREELQMMLWMVEINTAYRPGPQYLKEVRQEKHRLYSLIVQSPESKAAYPLTRAGKLRADVFARFAVRRRWEKLGVWNESWGIPGRRDARANDNPMNWNWKWEESGPASAFDCPFPDLPTVHAVNAREGLMAGQRRLTLTKPPLGENPSKSEGRHFITSRPWFVWGVDVAEENARLERISRGVGIYCSLDPEHRVRSWWTRACLTQLHGVCDPQYAWKWGYEKPPPDSSDISLEGMSLAEREAMDDIDSMPNGNAPEDWVWHLAAHEEVMRTRQAPCPGERRYRSPSTRLSSQHDSSSSAHTSDTTSIYMYDDEDDEEPEEVIETPESWDYRYPAAYMEPSPPPSPPPVLRRSQRVAQFERKREADTEKTLGIPCYSSKKRRVGGSRGAVGSKRPDTIVVSLDPVRRSSRLRYSRNTTR